MQDFPDQPPLARPIDGFDVSYATVEARPVVDRRYPLLAQSMGDAAIDLGVVVCLLICFRLLFDLSGLTLLMIEWWPRVGVFCANLVLGVASLLVVGMVLLHRRQSVATIGLNKPSVKRLVAGIGIGMPGCYLAALTGFAVYVLFAGFEQEAILDEKRELFEIVLDFPAAWVVPFTIFVGIHEEVLFRGFLLTRIRAITNSNVAAILVTGAFFGLLHFYQGGLGVCQTAAIGIALAALAVYARTLWPAIFVHAAFDGMNMLAMPWLSELLEELSREMEVMPAACATFFQ
jgi:membrane protease YdiL (CAAX protease family)